MEINRGVSRCSVMAVCDTDMLQHAHANIRPFAEAQELEA